MSVLKQNDRVKTLSLTLWPSDSRPKNSGRHVGVAKGKCYFSCFNVLVS